MNKHILAIDQGTTSSRALVFNSNGQQEGISRQEFTQFFPADGWVEHDASEIWQTTLASIKGAIADAKIHARDLDCIGITNQRETTIVWNRANGQPIYNAIVWQDRRTSKYCQELKQQGLERK
ncbi:MAG: FGGY family carbohydrate kinase, partial [Pseudohongiella sp.]